MADVKEVRFSKRASRRLNEIADYYFDEGGSRLAEDALQTLVSAAERLGALPVIYRTAARAGLHEYVVERFPYLLLYRVTSRRIDIVGILHQRENR